MFSRQRIRRSRGQSGSSVLAQPSQRSIGVRIGVATKSSPLAEMASIIEFQIALDNSVMLDSQIIREVRIRIVKRE